MRRVYWHVCLAILSVCNAVVVSYRVTRLTTGERSFDGYTILCYGAAVYLAMCLFFTLEARLLHSESRAKLLSDVMFFLVLSFLHAAQEYFSVAELLNPLTAILFLLARVLTLVGLSVDFNADSLRSFLLAALVASLVQYLFLMGYNGADWQGVLWPSTDARHYHWLSSSLVRFSPEKSYFQLGLPMVMAPFNYCQGTFLSRDYDLLQQLNKPLLVLNAVVLFSWCWYLLAKTATKIKSSSRPGVRTVTLASVLVFFLVWNYAYVIFPPSYASDRDVLFHPVMMLGFVPSVEILNALFAAMFVYLLVSPDRVSGAWVGVTVGAAILVKMTNVLIAGPFFLFYVTRQRLWRSRRILEILVTSTAVYSMQLVYNAHAFGSVLMGTRQHQWSSARAAKWADYANRVYDLDVAEAALLSFTYAKTNLAVILTEYKYVLVVFVVAAAILVRREKQFRHVWWFCLLVVFLFIVFHSGFIRVGATFRYLHAVVPLVLLVYVVSFWRFGEWVLQLTKRRLAP